MHPTEKVRTKISELACIYTKAKQMILLAEELDPSFRSNVMVIKELRDSNDHIMRLFNELFVNKTAEKDESYMIAQIDKARGHVFRAGYDAIDGIVVSYKIKVARAMEKISTGAISDIYPDYYTHAVAVDGLCEQVAFHRNNKNVTDDSLQNLENYAVEAKKVAEFCKTALAKVPLMVSWDKKNRWKVILEQVLVVLFVGIVLAFAYAFAEHLLNRDSTYNPKMPASTNSVSISTNK